MKSEAEAAAVHELEQDERFDLWSQVRVGRSVDIMAAPHHVSSLRTWLHTRGLGWTLLIPDVAALMELEQRPAAASNKMWVGHNMDWTQVNISCVSKNICKMNIIFPVPPA